MNIYVLVTLLIIGIVFLLMLIASGFDQTLSGFIAIAFIALFVVGVCMNADYLSSTKFKPDQIYTLQGKVNGYDSEDKKVYLNQRELDGQLLKDKDTKNITIGDEIKAKIVFCPSGKIGVLEIKKVERKLNDI